MNTCPKCGVGLGETSMLCPGCGADTSLWIARDGQVYGPYTLTDLRRAQTEGRLGADDRVKVGEGDWEPLSPSLTDPATSLPPPPVGYPPPPPAPQPGYPAGPKAPKQQDKTALIAMGFVLGGFLFIMLLLAAILFPVFAKAREKARQASCLSNLKQLELGVLMYAQDYNERFPLQTAASSPSASARLSSADRLDVNADFPAGDWRRAILPYVRNSQIYVCPATLDRYSYEYYRVLSAFELRQISQPAQLVTLYESGFLDGCKPPPHNGGYNVGFADGHVKWMQSKTGVLTQP